METQMHRIIVADDERHVVDWIADLISSNISDAEVLTCFSGLEVMKLVETRIPSIAILDIRMPGLDGIETARQVLEKYPSCKIILLTAFDEFELIYQVNQNKNIQYILKSESSRTILGVIEQTLVQIQEEQIARQSSNAVMEKALLLRHFEQRGILYDIIFESSNQTPVDSKLKLYARELSLCAKAPVILTLLQLSKDDPFRVIVQNTQLLYLYRCLTDALGTTFTFSILDIASHSFLLLAQKRDTPTSEEDIVFWHSELDRIFSVFQTSYPRNMRYLSSCRCLQWGEIAASLDAMMQYDQNLAPELLSQPLYGAILTDALREDVGQVHGNLEFHAQLQKILVQLFTALGQFDQQAYDKAFCELKAHKKALTQLSQSEQAVYRGKLSIAWLDLINQHHLDEQQDFQPTLAPLYRFVHQTTWDAYFSFLEHLSSDFFAYYKEEAWSSNTQTVQHLKDYIRDNLSSPLSVTDISIQFNYSQAYISRLFRKVTGQTMSQYIKNARLDEAKRLLRKSNLSVQEIAKAAGFDTAQYFSLVFRKEVGVTPTAYRQGNK